MGFQSQDTKSRISVLTKHTGGPPAGAPQWGGGSLLHRRRGRHLLSSGLAEARGVSG